MTGRASGAVSMIVSGSLCLFIHNNANAIDGTPVWIESMVDSPAPGDSMTTPVLAFDHFGTPSVSWSSGQGAIGFSTVYRSEFLGLGFWAHREVASGVGVGTQTALSFDRAERPTIAWVNSNGSVNAEYDDNGSPVVVTGGANSDIPALSVTHDLAGNLRGLFSGQSTGDLFDINGGEGAYSSSSMTTLSALNGIADARLTTDHSGLRHVIARGSLTSGSQGVIISSEPSFGGSWPSLTLTAADEINGVGIATDPTDGNVAITYTTRDTSTNTSKLFYAKFNGFALESTEVLSSTSAVFHDVDLAFDLSDGRPAIALEREVTSPFAEELVFAYLDGASQWQTSLVDDSISIDNPFGGMRRPSLAFDDFGTSWPAIAYIDADESLNVAFDPPVPEPNSLGLLIVGLVILAARSRR